MIPPRHRTFLCTVRRFAVAGLLLAALHSPVRAEAPAKIAPALQPFVDSHVVAGAVTLVATPEKVLSVEAVGFMDIAGGRAMRTDCLFWIASQSKPMTGAAFMTLVDEGKVNLDDPVEKYLPEFKGQMVAVEQDAEHVLLKKPRHPILIREILSHTSGLNFKSPIEEPTLDLYPLETRVRSYAMMPLLFEPGTQSKYSNAGINTAGRIIEVVSGMSDEKFMEERLFKPLGMKDTTFRPNAAQLARLAKAYKPDATKQNLEECPIIQLHYPLDAPQREPMPAGGLFSTAQDVAKFYRMLANGGALDGVRVLSENAVATMTADQSGEAKSNYGIGIGTNDGVITHGGAYSTNSAYDRERKLITIFLVQQAGWARNGKEILPTFKKAALAFSAAPDAPRKMEPAFTVGIAGANTGSTAAPAANPGIVNSIGMALVPIPAGTFVMGQDGPPTDYQMTKHPDEAHTADWDEKPAHSVTITRPFHMGKTEVTRATWRKFRPEFQSGSAGDDEAVRGVSWHDAVAFCEWLSKKEGRTYRLPTEAEWEYACRAGTTTIFHTGDTLDPRFQKWFRDENRRSLYFPGEGMPPEYRHLDELPAAKVAQTRPNAWGLHDMHGNVWEWCADWYGPYEASPQIDPKGRSDGDFRVFRGGAHSRFSRLLRSANRGGWLPETTDNNIGFRVVLGDPASGTLLPPPQPPLNARNISQSFPKIELPPVDVPFFEGPKVFVKIPPDSHGPLFSWHNHSPAITECPNGDLLATWFSCADEGGSELCNLASRLRLGTGEWEPASPFWDGADVNDHAPKLWWDGEKTIFHLARGLAENILRTSTDSGATWSKARVLFPNGEFGNQLIRTRDGTLAITHDSRTAGLVTSRDGGKSWTAVALREREKDIRPGGTGQRPPGIHAPVVELGDGRLMAISRQDPVEDQAAFHGRTPVSISADGGKTWTFSESEFPAISTAQRAVLIWLKEGPLLLCSYTDQSRDRKTEKGMTFKAADGSEFTGFGLFAAISLDDGKTWPFRRLVTPGGEPRELPTIDRGKAIFSDTRSERSGYLAATQTRDRRIQLVSSKNHYVFNLAWLKQLPTAPRVTEAKAR